MEGVRGDQWSQGIRRPEGECFLYFGNCYWDARGLTDTHAHSQVTNNRLRVRTESFWGSWCVVTPGIDQTSSIIGKTQINDQRESGYLGQEIEEISKTYWKCSEIRFPNNWKYFKQINRKPPECWPVIIETFLMSPAVTRNQLSVVRMPVIFLHHDSELRHYGELRERKGRRVRCKGWHRSSSDKFYHKLEVKDNTKLLFRC